MTKSSVRRPSRQTLRSSKLPVVAWIRSRSCPKTAARLCPRGSSRLIQSRRRGPVLAIWKSPSLNRVTTASMTSQRLWSAGSSARHRHRPAQSCQSRSHFLMRPAPLPPCLPRRPRPFLRLPPFLQAARLRFPPFKRGRRRRCRFRRRQGTRSRRLPSPSRTRSQPPFRLDRRCRRPPSRRPPSRSKPRLRRHLLRILHPLYRLPRPSRRRPRPQNRPSARCAAFRERRSSPLMTC